MPLSQDASQSPDDRPDLLGRDVAVCRLDAALDECGQGRPSLVEIAGEPGIGKTRLLQHFAVRARSAGIAVMAGTGGPLTNGSLRAMMRAVTERTDLGGNGDSPSLVPPPPGRSSWPRRGLALLLDDLHRADEQSLALLARLLRVPPDQLVVVATYRPRQVGRALATALAGATAMRRELVQLTPLDAAQIGALLGLEPGPAADRVHAASAGNPLYARAYRGTGRSTPDDQPLDLPVEVALVLQLELDTLTEDERRVAQAAAVLGDGFDPAETAAVAGLNPPCCAVILDRLVSCDLLRADLSAEPGLRFRHPVVRAAVYGSTPPGARRQMHATAAATLHALGRSPGRYAEHVARSAQPGDLAAVRTLLRAVGDRPANPETAVRWLSIAQGLLPDGSDGSELRSEVDLCLANALVAAGQLHEGRALLQEVACRPVPVDDQRSRTVLARAAVERLLGRPQDAYALVQAELAIGCERPESATGRLLAEAAVSGVLCGEPAAAEHAALVRKMAEAAGDPGSAARAGIVEAFTVAYLGDMAEAAAALDRAAVLIDATPDGCLVPDLGVLGMLAWAEMLNERDQAARWHFDRALDLARTCGHEPLRSYLLVGRCFIELRQGHLDRAGQDAEEAEERARALGMESLAGLARSYRATVLAWQVGPWAARPVAESALMDVALGRRDGFGEVSLRVAARLRHQCDDRTDAMAALLRGCGDTGLSWVEACNRPYWAVVLAEMARANGRADEARRWVEEADRFASRLTLRGQAAYVAEAHAQLALDAGCTSAGALARSAVQTFADLGWRLAEGNARLLNARILCAGGRWRDAEAELAEVRQIAEVTGSRTMHRSVVDAQRRIVGYAGRSVGADTPAGGTAVVLTRREQDIVRLVAAGVSNAEVADRLYVTVKTVEAHLTRIFRKLGVSSRVGVAAMVAGQDLGAESG